MEDLNDDFVATLLAKEANNKRNGYATNGVQALLPRHTRGKFVPKPNTRFLRNIVREADSHNAALRVKEEAESRARLRSLQGQVDPSGTPRSSADRRRRHDRRPARTRSSRSRSPTRNSHGDDARNPRRSESRERRSRGHWISRSPESRNRDKHKRRQDRNDDGRRNYRSTERHTGRKRLRYDSDGEDSPPNKDTRPTRRQRSPGPSGAEEEPREALSRRLDSDLRSSSFRSSPDPLEELIGPAVPPGLKPRGRGTTGGHSAMDSRFSDNYDPSLDVRPDSDEDDWDNALEAYRDRQKWKSQGAERLRSAGFDENFISAWENNATKDESHLKWSVKGTTREWDRGKQITDTGEILLKAQWRNGT